MVKRILHLWWLVLAWILTMVGKDFWGFNVMEVFASLAIIIGVIWTCIRWRRERNRKLKLITFPDIWVAYRRDSQGILEIQMYAEVYIPHLALAYKARAEIEGQEIQMQFSKPQSTFVGGRYSLGGKVPLSPISQQAKTIEVSVEIQLDGEIKKGSGKRTIAINDA